MHLEAGGYMVTAGDSDNIVVSWSAGTEEAERRVRVEIKCADASADVYVSRTPNNDFRATIQVPRHSNLWGRLSAGELRVEDVEGDKDVEALAGRIVIEIPHPEQYGRRDASVLTGSISAPAFEVSKGGMFRWFEQSGPGKYRLHARVLTGEVNLRNGD